MIRALIAWADAGYHYDSRQISPSHKGVPQSHR